MKTKPNYLLRFTGVSAAILLTIAIFLFALIQYTVNSVVRKYKDTIELGRKYFLELDYEKAILAFQDAVNIDPKSLEAYEELASIYLSNGDYESAIYVMDYAVSHVASDSVGVARQRLDSYRTMRDEAASAAVTRITGRVADENGSPVQGASVTLINSSGESFVSDTTDDKGEYYFDLEQRAPGSYEIRISHEGYLDETIEYVAGEGLNDAGTSELSAEAKTDELLLAYAENRNGGRYASDELLGHSVIRGVRINSGNTSYDSIRMCLSDNLGVYTQVGYAIRDFDSDGEYELLLIDKDEGEDPKFLTLTMVEVLDGACVETASIRSMESRIDAIDHSDIGGCYYSVFPYNGGLGIAVEQTSDIIVIADGRAVNFWLLSYDGAGFTEHLAYSDGGTSVDDVQIAEAERKFSAVGLSVDAGDALISKGNYTKQLPGVDTFLTTVTTYNQSGSDAFRSFYDSNRGNLSVMTGREFITSDITFEMKRTP